MTDHSTQLDVVSLGEVMLRLSPPFGDRLSRCRDLSVQVAGSQYNVAADLSRFGAASGFITMLPDNDLGRLVVGTAADHGVDTSRIKLVSGHRLGLNFVELGVNPTPAVVYDRSKSAASTIGPSDFDWHQIVRGARVAHTDGIFLGLSPSTQDAAVAFLAAARAQGVTTSFDINYRAHLWGPEEARTALERVLSLVDVLVTNADVSREVFGFAGTASQVNGRYQETFGCDTVLFTSRARLSTVEETWSVVAQIGDGQWLQKRSYSTLDRYGTGDAFLAGYLYGLSSEWDVENRLRFAATACAMAHSVNGDVALFSAEEIQSYSLANRPILKR